ncbi:MAG: thymidine kinase [Candidatus Eremiobacteraeota bacterium]|nr:thymidine kinase [Candidatus Eremiobacteraeota bacterium]
MTKKGSLEIICGSMFSGKSEELIRRIKRAQIARLKVQVFKPSMDSRFGVLEVVSHSGFTIKALPVTHPDEILEQLEEDTEVVAIDEVQFFPIEVAEICDRLASRGLRVIVAGLDMDFKGEPFGPVPYLMAKAESVDKLNAICVVCGGNASRSQRIINGHPAEYDSPTILVGASEKYEARCRHCHNVPLSPAKYRQEEELPLKY